MPTIIDLDEPPYIPDGWELVSHQGGGQWGFDVIQTELWLTPLQGDGNSMEHGDRILQELGDRAALNANVLDWLLLPENRHRIPNSWRPYVIYFWGTIYSWNRGKWKVVRCLQYSRTSDGTMQWVAGDTKLSAIWGTNMKAIIRPDSA
jgi:hypothetical protein